MYGQAQKCPEQIEIDEEFLKKSDNLFQSRKVAAVHHVDLAWGYYYKGHPDSAMIRFNQAWLLDSSNADIYWGFGNILGQEHKFEESLKYLERSLEMNPNNSSSWLSASSSYGQLFYQTKDINLLNKAIDYLKKSVALNPKNAQAYGQLAASYTYFTQKDSARKYLEITDQLDSTAVNPEVRKILKED